MRRPVALAVALALAVLAGCAQMPHSGPVKVGPQLSQLSGLSDEPIRDQPAGPLPSMSATELVSGFLRALIDNEQNYEVARSFLTSSATWNSGQSITTFDPQSLTITHTGSTVFVRAVRVGEISARGSFTVEPGIIHRRFSVVREDGEWRIAQLASGVLLSTDDAQRSLQPANVYFLNANQERLVPDPLLVEPHEPGLATTLIQDLIAGPSPSLAPAVHSAVLPGVSLVGNVPINAKGVAEVNLSLAARQLSAGALIRLSAQVVWTLKQLSSVTAVQMLDNGTPLSAPNVASLQSVNAWSQFDPAAPPAADGAIFVRGGQPAALESALPPALAHSGLAAPAQSADGSVVAGLRGLPGRVSLLVGSADGPLSIRATAPTITAPAFDTAGDVLVAEAGAGIVEYPEHGAAQTVSLPVSFPDEIQDLALSRDGARIAAVVGPPGATALVLGTISWAPHPSVHDVHVVLPAGRNVSGVAWLSADQLVCTVAGSHGRRSVVEVSVDGYQVQPIGGVGLPGPATQVAAAPNHRVLATADGGIWALTGRLWQRVATGTDPSYAG